MSRAAVALGVVLALAPFAYGQDDVDVRLPLGDYTREGRPVVVRARGADRVRGPVGPWAMPQGAANDEFVLPPRPGGGPLALDVERDGRVSQVLLDVEVLPAGVTVTAVFDGGRGSSEKIRDVRVPTEGLPTIREAWLLFDSVHAPPDGLDAAVRSGIDAWRDGVRPGSPFWPAMEPLVHWPEEEVFGAAHELTRSAPHVTRGVVTASTLLAVVFLALILVTRLRREQPLARAAWIALPGAAFVAWLALAGPLPGAVRATAVVFEAPTRGLVLVRLEALRAGEVHFDLPEGASSAAFLRYDAEDATARDASAGRHVHARLEAGERRLVAYSLPLVPDPPEVGVGAEWPPPVQRWLRKLGVGPAGRGTADPGPLLPVDPSVPVLAAAVVRVEAGK